MSDSPIIQHRLSWRTPTRHKSRGIASHERGITSPACHLPLPPPPPPQKVPGIDECRKVVCSSFLVPLRHARSNTKKTKSDRVLTIPEGFDLGLRPALGFRQLLQSFLLVTHRKAGLMAFLSKLRHVSLGCQQLRRRYAVKARAGTSQSMHIDGGRAEGGEASRLLRTMRATFDPWSVCADACSGKR